MINEISEYFKTFEGLAGQSISLNYTPSRVNTFCIKTAECSPVIERYVDGGKKMQYIVSLCARASYSFDFAHNSKIISFFENFSNWLAEQDKNKNYPEAEGIEFLSVEPVSSVTVISNDVSTAEYLQNIKFIYYKKG